MILTDFAAHSYTSGSNIQDARRVFNRLAEKHIAITTCYWNDSLDDADSVCRAYLTSISVIRSLPYSPYLSIKLPALQFDGTHVRQVVSAASQCNVPVHFDALAIEQTDAVFRVIEDCRPLHRTIGCTLPGRWRRSILDADRAVSRGLSIRVVKGEWPDPMEPGRDMFKGFLDIVDRLAGRARYVALATHDPELARQSVNRLRAAGTGCGLEMLYGVPPRRMLRLAAQLNIPVRIYVPFGRAWLPYRLKQIPNNPRIAGWFVRDLMRATVKSIAA